ncbi:hypothetical protein [Azospirillum doebereinerae]|uniref:Uncharacterized protein n=1 Tax=Azospirillum doebereinerae TaxID=92933 RepID=A0A433IZ92_9PROT|nr:hypothetical protein [Azospirillum doebereinerae]RUQ60416.1 hypothetical protein EJ913_30585 [Azospirillum doebereinerae]
MFRTILLGGFAVALLAGSAMADTLPGRPGGFPGLGSPGLGGLTATNVGTTTNTAAGIGNTAQQRATGMQSGPMGSGPGVGFGPLVSTNVGVATNTAAGLNNTAQQRVLGSPGVGNGVQVGLNMTGRGPLVSTNVDYTTNVAAGLGNVAGQRATGLRR